MSSRSGVARLTLTLFVLGTVPEARAQHADSWTGRDKALHLSAGSVLAGGGYALASLKLDEREKRVVTGLGLSLGASAAKELYDRRSGGDPSWRDFTWGAAGAATGVTVAWLVDRIRHARRATPAARVVRAAPRPG